MTAFVGLLIEETDVTRGAAMVIAGMTALFLQIGSGSAAAAQCPNEAIRVQQGASYLPDCRAYELVSPADKRGGSVNFGGGEAVNGPTLVSPDGSAVLYPSYFAFADAQGVVINSYRAIRGPNGWASVNVSPTPSESGTLFSEKGGAQEASDDLSTTLFFTQRPLDPLDEGNPPFGDVDIYAREGLGPFDWISRPNEGGGGPGSASAEFVGRSADARHVVFMSTEVLAPPPNGPAPVQGRSVYERFDGRTTMINVDDAGEATSGCGALSVGGLTAGLQGLNSVSADGSRIAFLSPDPAQGCAEPQRLFLRLNDQRTVEVSAPQISPPPEPGSIQPVYQGMSQDGSTVFFDAATKMTIDGPEGSGLYAYDTSTASLRSLGAQGNVLTASADGRRLLIEYPGVGLTFADNGILEPVASFSGGTVSAATINPSGSRVAFVTSESLAGAQTGGQEEVYTFSPTSGELDCASCGSGVAPGPASLGGGTLGPSNLNRNVSADGEFVFFVSSGRLAPGDSNSLADVYEWHQGDVRLLSGGGAGDAAYFAGASADGDTVVFSTSASLVPQDTDSGAKDLYSARIDGGYLASPTPTPCREEECQGPPSLAPSVTSPGSASLTAAAAHKAQRAKKAHRRRAHRRCRVSTSAHGRKKAKGCRPTKKHHSKHRPRGKQGNGGNR